MSQNSQNPFSMWMDMNKNMYDAWNTWASQMTQNAAQPAVDDKANPFNAYFEFMTKSFEQNPFFAGLSGNTGNFVEQMTRQWQDAMKSMSMFIPNPALRDGFDRFVNAYQMFNSLQSYWDTFLKNLPSDVTDWNAYAKPILDYYQNLSNGFLQPFMPEQLKSIFALPFEDMTTVQQTFVNFFKPWLEDSAELQGLFFKALQGDKEAYQDFLKAWAEAYKNSAAKLLNAPAVGANREGVEKIMKLMDHYVNFVVSFNEYTGMISGLLTETMEKLLKHLVELQAEGNPPQTFMEFYKIWSNYNEKAFQELFVTDAFAKIMNETVSSGSKLKVLFDDYMQDLLAFLPLPNRREIDGVEEEVYLLRKRVKALEKELKAFKDQKPQAAPSATRSAAKPKE
ncbi:MAG: hypothetical protein FWG40_11405 [Peptococcaceae bacterium]|nr:hypothetical protein [Peptococcaceae bacterium]